MSTGLVNLSRAWYQERDGAASTLVRPKCLVLTSQPSTAQVSALSVDRKKWHDDHEFVYTIIKFSLHIKRLQHQPMSQMNGHRQAEHRQKPRIAFSNAYIIPEPTFSLCNAFP
jgi:hypothetical protein